MDEALLCLLEKKEYEFISVKEVCRKAGVNRSTFYLHYEGMDDLLQEAVAMKANVSTQVSAAKSLPISTTAKRARCF